MDSMLRDKNDSLKRYADYRYKNKKIQEEAAKSAPIEVDAIALVTDETQAWLSNVFEDATSAQVVCQLS